MTQFCKRRRSVGLAQFEVARKLKVSPATVCKWESGDVTPSPRFYPLLAKLFKMKVEEVVDLFASSTVAA